MGRPKFIHSFMYALKYCSSSRKNLYQPHERSSEIPRERGVLKVKILEAKYEAKLEFPGGMGGAKQKTFHGGSMDIFWNCTLHLHTQVKHNLILREI